MISLEKKLLIFEKERERMKRAAKEQRRTNERYKQTATTMTTNKILNHLAPRVLLLNSKYFGYKNVRYFFSAASVCEYSLCCRLVFFRFSFIYAVVFMFRILR